MYIMINKLKSNENFQLKIIFIFSMFDYLAINCKKTT